MIECLPTEPSLMIEYFQFEIQKNKFGFHQTLPNLNPNLTLTPTLTLTLTLTFNPNPNPKPNPNQTLSQEGKQDTKGKQGNQGKN